MLSAFPFSGLLKKRALEVGLPVDNAADFVAQTKSLIARNQHLKSQKASIEAVNKHLSEVCLNTTDRELVRPITT